MVLSVVVFVLCLGLLSLWTSHSLVHVPPPLCILKLARDSSNLIGSTSPHNLPPSNSPSGHRFTTPSSLALVHRLRRACTHVLVGVGTVLSDDPSLNVRTCTLPETYCQPTRVVIDPSLSLLSPENRLRHFNVLYPVAPAGVGGGGGESNDARGAVGPTVVYYRPFGLTTDETTDADVAIKNAHDWYKDVDDRLAFYESQASDYHKTMVTFRELPSRVPVPHFVLRDLSGRYAAANACKFGATSPSSSSSSSSSSSAEDPTTAACVLGRPDVKNRACVLVEGGATTAEHFLKSGKVTHALVVNSRKDVFGTTTTTTMEGGRGIPSRLGKSQGEKTFGPYPYCGLKFLGRRREDGDDEEGDDIECWSKDGIWPGEGDVTRWP